MILPTILSEVQPRVRPMLMAKIRVPRAPKRIPAPAASKCVRASPGTSLSRGRAENPSTIATIPTGTLIKKIQCQLKYCEMKPPRTGPAATPTDAKVVMMPSAFPRPPAHHDHCPADGLEDAEAYQVIDSKREHSAEKRSRGEDGKVPVVHVPVSADIGEPAKAIRVLARVSR